jgi:O6-methylguanine-DNA--protein-cysteine methyltransferase
MLNMATMNWTRKRVFRAVRELSRGGGRVTYQQIADRAECSPMTARRAVLELITDGRIEIFDSGCGRGHFYKIIKR